MNSDHALDSQRSIAGQTIAASIPAAMLYLHFTEADNWCLIPPPPREGSAAILRECLMTCWRAPQSPTESGCHDLAQTIIHLIGASFRRPLATRIPRGRSARAGEAVCGVMPRLRQARHT